MSQFASSIRLPGRVSASRTALLTPRARTVRMENNNSRFFLALFLAFSAVLVAVLLINTTITARSFAVSQKRAQMAHLESTKEHLRSNLREISSSENLAILAGYQGLVPAQTLEYRQTSSGKVVRTVKRKTTKNAGAVYTLPHTSASVLAVNMYQQSQGALLVVKKPAPKPKTSTAKATKTTKKPATKNSAKPAKKTTTKKSAAKKTTTKKPAAKKPAAKKPR